MYCKNCGTVNPEVADYCLKCGRGFAATAGADREAPTPVEIALAARSKTLGSSKKSLTSRIVVAGLAVGLVLMIPAVLMLRQMADMAETIGAKTDPSLSDSAPSGNQDGVGAGPGDVGAIAGKSTTPAVPPIDSANRPRGQELMLVAKDAALKANAMRLQMAVAMFYAENDRYPESLSEIPPQTLGFEADPNVYHYSVTKNPYGYRIEVIMNSRDVSGSHIVTEGNVTKYVYQGQ